MSAPTSVSRGYHAVERRGESFETLKGLQTISITLIGIDLSLGGVETSDATVIVGLLYLLFLCRDDALGKSRQRA